MMAWTDDTYREFDRLSEARSDFMNITRTSNVRQACDDGDLELMIRAWEQLGIAVSEFVDHLSASYPTEPAAEQAESATSGPAQQPATS